MDSLFVKARRVLDIWNSQGHIHVTGQEVHCGSSSFALQGAKDRRKGVKVSNVLRMNCIKNDLRKWQGVQTSCKNICTSLEDRTPVEVNQAHDGPIRLSTRLFFKCWEIILTFRVP